MKQLKLFLRRYLTPVFGVILVYTFYWLTWKKDNRMDLGLFLFSGMISIFLFLLLRFLDDYQDYPKDLLAGKVLLSRDVLGVGILMTALLAEGFFLALWNPFYCLCLGLILVYGIYKKWYIRIWIAPLALCGLFYYSKAVFWNGIVILALSILGTLLYGVCKKEQLPSLQEVGGKAYHLYQMNLPNTPAFGVLPVSVLYPYNARLVRAYISSFTKEGKRYAVRSSAPEEDGCSLSFAGIHDSFLNVKPEEIEGYVHRVMESAVSSRAMEYRKMNGLSLENITIAVVIQEMVEADYAGVLFSVNPSNTNTFESVISVCRGLGDKLVDGSTDGTTYSISGDSIRVSGEDILDRRLLVKLMQLKNRVMSKNEHFQDMEFAIKGRRVYFLQTRDITSLKGIGPKDLTLLIDNSNIIESYYGVTSPLTFSFAKEVYEQVYTETMKLGRVPGRTLDTLKPSLENMLYYHEGKIYYNIFSWYHVTSIFPSKKSLSYMESMMGVKSGSEGYKSVKLGPIALARLGIIFLSKLSKMDELSEIFKRRFSEIIDPYYGRELHLSNKECIDLYNQIDNEIIKEFTTPILNDCAVMFYFGSLKNKARRYSNGDEIVASAISNHGNVESMGSAVELERIMDKIRSMPEAFEDFKALSAEKLKQKYEKDSILSSDLESYIYRFGSRVMNELKLETVTMIENPVLLFEKLKEGLLLEDRKEASVTSVEIPKPLEKTAAKAREYVQNRESLRLRRTYAFSVIRNLFLNMGRNFVAEGRIDSVRDIFYLTKEEIFSLKPNYRVLVMERKYEAECNEGKEYFDRIAFYKNQPYPVVYGTSVNGITGIPSGNGIVSGRVSLLMDVNSPFTPGNIILAKRTDPGWISLFPMAKGLIVEHGSMLSHSFVVAREMGLPAVVAVNDATKLIHDGDTITLDSDKGVITIESR